MQEFLELLKPIFSAFGDGQYAYASALSLVALVAAAKTLLVPRFKFLQRPESNSVLVLLGSFGMALASPLGTGDPLSWALVWAAMKIAAAAAGGFALVKKLLVVPVLMPLRNKAPGWLKPVLSLVIWVFENDPLSKAKDAGDKAVKEKPSTGIPGRVDELP